MTASRLHALRPAPLGRAEIGVGEVELVKDLLRSDVLATGRFLARLTASTLAQRPWSRLAGEDLQRVAGARSTDVAPQ